MPVAVPAEPGLVLRPLSRVAYERLVESGLLADEPVELLEGALVEVMTEGPRHAWLVIELADALRALVPAHLRVRESHPLAAGDASEPEPDIAVVPAGSYGRDRHPAEAVLVVEVAETSRTKDLHAKARIYAAAGVPVYWVVDLTLDVVHVHRGPGATGYAKVDIAGFDVELEVPGGRLALGSLG
jgi:Uma2 family endonuclease